MRTIFFILILLSAYYALWISIGLKFTFIVFSLLMLTLATSFIVKSDFYIKYIKFVNPKAAVLYNNKDTNFRRNLRRTDIVVMYLLSAFILFLSIVIENSTMPIHGTIPIYLIAATVISTIIIWFFSLIIFKKSKKNSSFCLYSVALVSSVILILEILINFIS